jgi:hypothetical protein
MDVAGKMIAIVLLTAGLCWLPVHPAMAQSFDDRLQREFVSPPDSAKPRVWWHWMNGNVTKEGVQLDLQWMHHIGIGGVQNFDASYFAPKIVEQRLVFMTAPWREVLRYAVTLADQLGLEFAIASSPGWSESGAPWVGPQQGMKKLVWSETRVRGHTRFTKKLLQPPCTVGPFQDVPWSNPMPGGPTPQKPVPKLYKDVAVIAYRLPVEDRSPAELHPAVTSSAGPIDAGLLWDGDFTTAVSLPFGEQGNPAWIVLHFSRPRTIHSMSLALQGNPGHVGAELQSSRDGAEFRTIATAQDTFDVVQTVTFAPTTARYFRLLLPTPPTVQVPPIFATTAGSPQKEHRIAEFVLHTTPRVDHFEQKAGFFVGSGVDSPPTPHVARRDAISQSDVLDLTSRLRPDGSLDWTAPAGRWAVLRIGYSLLGTINNPASPEATGLEVDKLNRTAVKFYMDGYLGRYKSLLGSQLFGQRGLRAMVNDSWEAGAQNWTDELPAEFARRRGYDLRPWLPVLTGRIVGSATASEQFLWDFRRTLGDLLTESHYGQIAASLHERDMIHYDESHEIGRAFIGDGMDVKRDADVPMGAMWINSDFASQEQGDADLRESASVAHIYGQNLVAAESMTTVGIPGAAFAFSPENLKPTADRELADGVNRFVVHTSVHQPLIEKAPGFTLGPFGQWFTRNETWAEQAGPWVTYLARSSYLLQQGRFVADIAYYYGQDSNITALYGKHLPPIPGGYAFDFVSAHALTKLSVQDGLLITTSGMRYRLLALDPRTRLMSLDVLRQIARLVAAGATVVGDKPQATPSLADNAADFHALADALWSLGRVAKHRYGYGWILSGKSLPDAMADIKLEPDFSYAKPEADTTVWFVHRRLEDNDLYFINNRQDRAERIEARFRVSGKAPELWHADTGVLEPASYRQEGDHTIVPLKLDPYDAVFVVFRKGTPQRELEVVQSIRESLGTLTGPWHVQFPSGRGAPDQTTFTELKSWTTDSDPGIKYFSGTARYETNLDASASWLTKGQRVEIDLGRVKNVATVVVNGQSAGIVWKSPFRIDVTDFLEPGTNRLTIYITNLWPNRLIGDKQPNAAPIAFTTFNPYSADSPLLDSGLLGPVKILRVSTRGAQ